MESQVLNTEDILPQLLAAFIEIGYITGWHSGWDTRGVELMGAADFSS